MNTALNKLLLQATNAKTARVVEVIQPLWSGYGEIVRTELKGGPIGSAVVKHICLPAQVDHPRGWNTEHSHQRKLKSYQVEKAWYQDWSYRCGDHCRVAKCYGSGTINQESLIVLEDLDEAGFPQRKTQLNKSETLLCLHWLANFHATFLGATPKGLWEIGSYWHLATRPDELAAIKDTRLRRSAPMIDAALNQCQFKTLVHGDAKLANFCFDHHGRAAAMVDFQYVGGGCGMKDVAYFLGSCISEQQCEQWQEELLDYYFSSLQQSLLEQGKQLDWDALEKEWRQMFPIAWTDFYRFLLGWMPTHHKINPYTLRLASQVLTQLAQVD